MSRTPFPGSVPKPVVFSIFSRKGRSPFRRERSAASRQRAADPSLAGERPAAPDTLAARREAARLTAEKIDRIESEMIADGLRPAGPSTLPQVAQAAVPMAVVAPPSRPVTDLVAGNTSSALGDPSNAMAIDINASSLPGVLEEAAILYANGQAPAAAAALKQALAESDLGGYQQLGWLMLLDLHQFGGDKEAFEALALDYAARFESSPPAWVGAEGGDLADVRQATTGSMVALPARLDEAVTSRLDLIERGLERRRETTVDCTPLQFCDTAGATRMLGLFAQAARAAGRHVLVVRGAQKLFDVARAAIDPGRRDDSDACWMLALFALRLLGDEQAFEDLGIEYCVTFEVSPPSWEPLSAAIRAGDATPRSGMAQAPAGERASPPAEPNAFVLSGDMTGRAVAAIRGLKAFSAGRSDVVVDCRNLRRLEFLAAGELLNEVANLRSAGKQVLFAEPNRLVYALMLVMGIQELAEIRKRRI